MSVKPQARVVCMCMRYRVDDLGLELRRGDVVWVKEDAVRASPGLAVAMRAGAVSVSWRVRCEVARPATPPWLNRNAKGRLVPVGHGDTPPVPRVAPESDPPSVVAPDPAVLHAAIRSMVEETVRAEVRAAFAGFVPAAQAPQAPPLDVDAISQAVVTAMLARGGMPVGATSPSTMVPQPVDDGPMFIPTGLVPTGNTPALDITEGASDGADLAGAQAAMRAARKSHKKTSP